MRLEKIKNGFKSFVKYAVQYQRQRGIFIKNTPWGGGVDTIAFFWPTNMSKLLQTEIVLPNLKNICKN